VSLTKPTDEKWALGLKFFSSVCSSGKKCRLDSAFVAPVARAADLSHSGSKLYSCLKCSSISCL
jgi:hypothetical protein